MATNTGTQNTNMVSSRRLGNISVAAATTWVGDQL